MLPQLRIAAASTSALVLMACQPGVMPLSEADTAAIAETVESYRQAVLAVDEAAIAASYTADGMEMPPHMPAVQGRDAIQERNEPLSRVTHFQLNSMETIGHGDLAYSRGTYTFTGMVEGMAAAIADTGKYLVVARRQEDGRWLVSRAIWNSDLPLAPMPGGNSQ